MPCLKLIYHTFFPPIGTYDDSDLKPYQARSTASVPCREVLSIDGFFERGGKIFVAAEVAEVGWRDGWLITSRRSQHIEWEVFKGLKGADNAWKEMGTINWLEMPPGSTPKPRLKSISIVCMLLSQYIAQCFRRREKVLTSKVSQYGDCHDRSILLAPQCDDEHTGSSHGTPERVHLRCDQVLRRLQCITKTEVLDDVWNMGEEWSGSSAVIASPIASILKPAQGTKSCRWPKGRESLFEENTLNGRTLAQAGDMSKASPLDPSLLYFSQEQNIDNVKEEHTMKECRELSKQQRVDHNATIPSLSYVRRVGTPMMHFTHMPIRKATLHQFQLPEHCTNPVSHHPWKPTKDPFRDPEI